MLFPQVTTQKSDVKSSLTIKQFLRTLRENHQKIIVCPLKMGKEIDEKRRLYLDKMRPRKTSSQRHFFEKG